MAFVDQRALASDSAFINRVEIALATAAIAVMAEDAQTEGHTRRIVYARDVLQDTRKAATQMALGVATNPAITLSSTDADIQFTVNSMFTAYSL